MGIYLCVLLVGCGAQVRDAAATGSSRPGPFALHFNGPAGRYRLGWCTAAMLRRAAAPRQYLVDVDRGDGEAGNNNASEGGEHGGEGGPGLEEGVRSRAQDGRRVPLPEYCGGVLPASTERTRTATPPRPVHPPLPCAHAAHTRRAYSIIASRVAHPDVRVLVHRCGAPGAAGLHKRSLLCRQVISGVRFEVCF